MIGEPVYYAAILALLLAFRLLWQLRASRTDSGANLHARNGLPLISELCSRVVWLLDSARSPPSVCPLA